MSVVFIPSLPHCYQLCPSSNRRRNRLEVEWLPQCPQCEAAELSLALENGFYLLVKNANLFRLVQKVLFYDMSCFLCHQGTG